MEESYGAIEDLLEPSPKATVERKTKTNCLHRLLPNPIRLKPTSGFVFATFVAVLLGVAIVAYMVIPDSPRAVSANLFTLSCSTVDTSLEEKGSAPHVSLEEAVNVILDAVRTAKETSDKALEHAEKNEEALAKLSDMIQNVTESAGLARDIALGVKDNATSLADEVGVIQQTEDELKKTTDMMSKGESLLDARLTAAEKKILEIDEAEKNLGETAGEARAIADSTSRAESDLDQRLSAVEKKQEGIDSQTIVKLEGRLGALEAVRYQSGSIQVRQGWYIDEMYHKVTFHEEFKSVPQVTLTTSHDFASHWSKKRMVIQSLTTKGFTIHMTLWDWQQHMTVEWIATNMKGGPKQNVNW